MKLTIRDVKSFSEVFDVVSSVVNRSIVSPLYQHVRLTATDTGVILDATDLDVYIRAPFAADVATAAVDVETPGVILLPARQFKAFLKQNKAADRIEIMAAPTGLIVNAYGTDYAGAAVSVTTTFQITDDPADFVNPSEPEPDALAVLLPSMVLRDAVDKTLFAIADERSRYTLNGVLVRVKNKDLDVVGADGSRMAWWRFRHGALPETATGRPIIPRSGVAAIRRVLACAYMGDADGEGILSIGKTHVRYRSGGVTVTSVILDGTYPDYDQILSTCGIPTRADVGHDDLARAVKHVSATVGKYEACISLTFRPAKTGDLYGTCRIADDDPDNGTSELIIRATCLDAFEMLVNPAYLSGWLTSTAPAKPRTKKERYGYHAPPVVFQWYGMKRPFILSHDDGIANPRYVYYAMGISLDDATCPVCQAAFAVGLYDPIHRGITRCESCAEAEAFSPAAPPHEHVGLTLRAFEGDVIALDSVDGGGVEIVDLPEWARDRWGWTCDVCGDKLTRNDEVVPVWDMGLVQVCWDCYEECYQDEPETSPYDRFDDDRAAALVRAALDNAVEPPDLPRQWYDLPSVGNVDAPRRSWLARVAGAIAGAIVTVYGS